MAKRVGNVKRAATAAAKNGGMRAPTTAATAGTNTPRMRAPVAVPPASPPTGAPQAPLKGRKNRTNSLPVGGNPMNSMNLMTPPGMRPGGFPQNFGRGGGMPGQYRGFATQTGQQGSSIFGALPNQGHFFTQQQQRQFSGGSDIFPRLPDGGRFANMQAGPQTALKRRKSTSDMNPAAAAGGMSPAAPQVVVNVGTGRDDKNYGKGMMGQEHLGSKIGRGRLRRQRSMDSLGPDSRQFLGQQPFSPPGIDGRRGFQTATAAMPPYGKGMSQQYPDAGPYQHQSRGGEGGGWEGEMGNVGVSGRGGRAKRKAADAARHALDTAKEAGSAGMESMLARAIELSPEKPNPKKLKKLREGALLEFIPRANPDGSSNQAVGLPLPTELINTIKSAAKSGMMGSAVLVRALGSFMWEHRDQWEPLALSAIQLTGPKGVAFKIAWNMLMK